MSMAWKPPKLTGRTASQGSAGLILLVIVIAVVSAVLDETNLVSQLRQSQDILQVMPRHPAEGAANQVAKGYDAQGTLHVLVSFGSPAAGGLSASFDSAGERLACGNSRTGAVVPRNSASSRQPSPSSQHTSSKSPGRSLK